MEWFPQKAKGQESDVCPKESEEAMFGDQWEQGTEHQEMMEEREEGPADEENLLEMGGETGEDEGYQGQEAQMEEQEQEDWYGEKNKPETDDEMEAPENHQQE